MSQDVLELIASVKNMKEIPYSEALYENLTSLYSDSKEEEPEGSGINIDSLKSFIEFIKFNCDFTCPAISLTPNNDIYVAWQKDFHQVFSLHFLSNGNVKFVLFVKVNLNDKDLFRISGNITESVNKTVQGLFYFIKWLVY